MIFIKSIFLFFIIICKEYSNPITNIESTDPTILKVNKKGYYIYSTGGPHQFMCIFRSENLINWVYVGIVNFTSDTPEYIPKKKDFIMLKIHTANSQSNIPSDSTLVTLETKDAIPETKYCKAIKVIKNLESNSVGIKPLSKSCDIKIEDKTHLSR
jgi:hypothetical protein